MGEMGGMEEGKGWDRIGLDMAREWNEWEEWRKGKGGIGWGRIRLGNGRDGRNGRNEGR